MWDFLGNLGSGLGDSEGTPGPGSKCLIPIAAAGGNHGQVTRTRLRSAPRGSGTWERGDQESFQAFPGRGGGAQLFRGGQAGGSVRVSLLHFKFYGWGKEKVDEEEGARGIFQSFSNPAPSCQ